MEPVHLHLLINHVPILVTIFAVLIMVWGMVREEKSYISLAMVGFIIAGVFSVVAFESGEASEDAVELLTGISESFIHDHEEIAGTANIFAILLAVVSIAGFIINKFKPEFFKWAKMLVVVMGFTSAGIFSYTAYLGGQIRHTEIQSEAIEEVDEYVEPCTEDEEEETLGDEFEQ